MTLAMAIFIRFITVAKTYIKLEIFFRFITVAKTYIKLEIFFIIFRNKCIVVTKTTRLIFFATFFITIAFAMTKRVFILIICLLLLIRRNYYLSGIPIKFNRRNYYLSGIPIKFNRRNYYLSGIPIKFNGIRRNHVFIHRNPSAWINRKVDSF